MVVSDKAKAWTHNKDVSLTLQTRRNGCSPFHSTQRVTRGVSGEFGRHGKIILTLDENIKWHDGWTNWHVVFTISKKRSASVWWSHIRLFLYIKGAHAISHWCEPVDHLTGQNRTRPSQHTGEVALPGNFRTSLSPSQTKTLPYFFFMLEQWKWTVIIIKSL